MKDRLEITVRVKAGSSKGPLVEETPDDPAATLTVFVRERAVDGAANAGVIAAIAAHFDVPKRSVKILRGHSSRIKRVAIER